MAGAAVSGVRAAGGDTTGDAVAAPAMPRAMAATRAFWALLAGGWAVPLPDLEMELRAVRLRVRETAQPMGKVGVAGEAKGGFVAATSAPFRICRLPVRTFHESPSIYFRARAGAMLGAAALCAPSSAVNAHRRTSSLGVIGVRVPLRNRAPSTTTGANMGGALLVRLH